MLCLLVTRGILDSDLQCPHPSNHLFSTTNTAQPVPAINLPTCRPANLPTCQTRPGLPTPQSFIKEQSPLFAALLLARASTLVRILLFAPFIPPEISVIPTTPSSCYCLCVKLCVKVSAGVDPSHPPFLLVRVTMVS